MNLWLIFVAGLNQQRKGSWDVLVKSSSQSASVHNYNRSCDIVYIIEIKFCFHIPDISRCKSFHTVNLFTACFVSWSQSLGICHSGLDHGITVWQILIKGLVVSTPSTENKRGKKKKRQVFTLPHHGSQSSIKDRNYFYDRKHLWPATLFWFPILPLFTFITSPISWQQFHI